MIVNRQKYAFDGIVLEIWSQLHGKSDLEKYVHTCFGLTMRNWFIRGSVVFMSSLGDALHEVRTCTSLMTSF